jgi:glycosyltransferase involved in cell wall biosynthesis
MPYPFRDDGSGIAGKAERVLVPRRLAEEIDQSTVRVSFIIATRNRGELLRKTLQNVREFLSGEDELIIVDGSSVDCTPDVVQENRDIVSTFICEPDSDESHAFNKGLSVARGRLIKAISDDDYFYPDAMRRIIEVAELLPEVDAIQAGGEIFEVEAGKSKFVKVKRLTAKGESPSQLDIFNCHIGLGLLVRRRVLSKIGGLSPGYASPDGDWHCKLIEAKCDVRYLDVNLYRWHIRAHSGMNSSDKIALSHMMFGLRLRVWEEFYGREPRMSARIMGLDATPEGVGFQYAVHLSQRVWRSRSRAILRLLPLLFDSTRHVGRTLRSVLGRDSKPEPGERETHESSSAQFTGKLLPAEPADRFSKRVVDVAGEKAPTA